MAAQPSDASADSRAEKYSTRGTQLPAHWPRIRNLKNVVDLNAASGNWHNAARLQGDADLRAKNNARPGHHREPTNGVVLSGSATDVGRDLSPIDAQLDIP